MPVKTAFTTEIEHVSILDDHGNFDEELGKGLIPDEDVVRLYEHMVLCRHYDEVAPELLLVAAHIGETGGNAEDLVQATFLAAMEQAGSFEPGRPLMPWLIGILVNRPMRQGKSVGHLAENHAHARADSDLLDHLRRREFSVRGEQITGDT